MDEIVKLTIFFKNVFMQEPWNDDWSNEQQLNSYIMDLIGNPNSMTLGFFDNDSKMAGLAMEFYKKRGFEDMPNHISFVKALM